MALSSNLPAYLITVSEVSPLENQSEQTAIILPAEAADMPDIWSFQWSTLWEQVYDSTEAIIKLTHTGELLGLHYLNTYCPLSPNINSIEF